ncbi:MAG: mechanosensitive ion channel family protein [Candidatus Bathyarchaeota archaeon]|nr:MAG: mechanosensitive ion channel family protein [Candidatus Bathyarchaeota archaeon]
MSAETLLVGFLVQLDLEGVLEFFDLEAVRTAAGVLVVIMGAFVFYKLSSKAIRAAILKTKGREEDAKMLVNFWRVAVAFVTPLFIIAVFFPQFWVIPTFLGAFGGLFLGWALQPVVSGVAAWLLITLKRPFRLGDRIHLPTLNLKGDVLDVGPMYTVLNQVGGSVESEEPVGRNILIPNNMLFGHPAVNFTPRWKQKPPKQVADQSVYTLDEVVVRITYDTDWEVAEGILLDAARNVTADIIAATQNDPYIRSDMYDYGIYLRLRYMTLATDRPRIKYEIEKRVSKAFSKNDKVDFAIPFVYSAKKGPKR